MRITLAPSVAAGLLALAAPQAASAMPAAGLGPAATAQAPGTVSKVEFKRRRDGSVYYVRPRFNDKGPYFFAYRGYAYPYYPGYTYRLSRGQLKPYDRPHRYKIAE